MKNPIRITQEAAHEITRALYDQVSNAEYDYLQADKEKCVASRMMADPKIIALRGTLLTAQTLSSKLSNMADDDENGTWGAN